MDDRIVKFLENKIVNTKSSPYTHTSMGTGGRKYFISDEETENFYKLYIKVLAENGNLSMLEKPLEIVPLIVDVDLRSNEYKPRLYTAEIIRQVISVYQEIIEEIITETDQEIRDKYKICCVLEKTESQKIGGKCKDGFHLHFPFFHTEQWVQSEYIRNQVLERVNNKQIFKKLNLSEPLQQVFDKSIPKNTWLMYGSTKDPKEKFQRWRLTKIYNKEMEKLQIKDVFKGRIVEASRDENLPYFLSIRNTEEPTPINNDIVKKTVKTIKNKIRSKRGYETIMEELIIAEQLLSFLAQERADNYPEWWEIGCILFNISEGIQKGLDLWISFSKRSDKFEEGVCEKKWAKMEMRHYTLGTLKYFAKTDNPSDYQQWNTERVNYELQQGISMANNDIAKIMYMMYEGMYVCADIVKDLWYEFKGHRWIVNQKGYGLRKKMSGELKNMYSLLASKFMNDSATNPDEEMKNVASTKGLLVSKLVEKLKNNAFKTSVMKEAVEYFYDEKFLERMDENTNLLVFENGVYDANNKIFRDGRPDDYCTKSTNLYYHAFEETDPKIQEIESILRKIFVNKNIYGFFSQTASDLIRGGNRHKIFVIWNGDGDNGKSIVADLLNHAFGDYFYSPPTSLLTGKQQQSSGPTPELVPCKGARAVVISETGNADILNCGTMKKLTGGDPFPARGLNMPPIQIIPHFGIILHCNKLPNVSSEDKASWNRIRNLPFESKFVKKGEAPKSIEEQWEKKIFPMDKKLKDRVKELAEPFIWWLINKYEFYGDSDLYEPEEIKVATYHYHKTNDFYMQFVDERLHATGNSEDRLNIQTVWFVFKEWFKDSYPGKKIPEKIQMQEAIEKKIGVSKKGIWKGFTIFDPNTDDPEESVI